MVVVVLAGVSGELMAQKVEPTLLQKGTIKLDKYTLPNEARRGTPTTKELGEDWWAIEVRFDTFVPMTEEVTIKFYTDMVDTLKKGERDVEPTVILTGETTYMNVPAGRGHVASMYLHPTSVIRYGGVRGREGIKRANVRIEVFEGGEKVDTLDMKEEKTDWIEALKSTGASEKAGVLLSPDQVPFHAFELLKFNQIKRATR